MNANKKLVLPIARRDHVQGPVNAPFSLVEYGDYQCPYCREAHSVIKELQEVMGKDLCFAYRNFPLTQIHPNAEHAAEAAETQGHFWEMHDILFEHQNALEDEDLVEYADEAGLDSGRMMDEVLHGAYSGHIRLDLQSGEKNGVDGTPVFFINGLRYDGEPSAKALMAALTGQPA